MEFTERKKEINNFLTFLAQIAKENPMLDFKSDKANQFIYGRLVRIGVSKDDALANLRDFPSPNYSGVAYYNENIHPESSFSAWINYYREKDTKAYVDSKWRYFCQFVSKDSTAKKQEEHMKVYVPLDAEHIDRGAKMIFDFLEINNISHVSNIGKDIRFDDIVIRLSNPTDAEFLINYIRSNPYLQNGLIKANPFAYNKDGIALAVDGSLSYNSTIAGLLALYIDDRKKYHLLDTVSYDDFYMFFDDILRRQFVTRENNDLISYFNINSDEELNNYKEVFSLIRKVNNPKYNFENIKDHFNKCLNGKLKTSQNKIDRVNRELLEAIDLMVKKFGVSSGIRGVETFYLTGDEVYITRTNNLRNRLGSSSFRSDLFAILKDQNKSFIDYAHEVMAQYNYDSTEVIVRK